MVNILTAKRANGRQLLLLVLEPQDVDHIKTGQVVVADSSRVDGYDVMVTYVPDGVRFKDMMKQELPALNAQGFQRIMSMAQQFPEVRRAVKTEMLDYNRQDADHKPI